MITMAGPFFVKDCFNLEVLPNFFIELQNESKSEWDFSHRIKVESFYNLVQRHKIHLFHAKNVCHTPYCVSSEHKEKYGDACLVEIRPGEYKRWEINFWVSLKQAKI